MRGYRPMSVKEAILLGIIALLLIIACVTAPLWYA